MTTAKHTPGPLIVDGFADCQLITKDVPVAQGRPIGIAKVYGPNMIADARLFAAAPELLEALQAVELARDSDFAEDWGRATELAASAIAKALGGAA